MVLLDHGRNPIPKNVCATYVCYYSAYDVLYTYLDTLSRFRSTSTIVRAPCTAASLYVRGQFWAPWAPCLGAFFLVGESRSFQRHFFNRFDILRFLPTRKVVPCFASVQRATSRALCLVANHGDLNGTFSTVLIFAGLRLKQR